MEKIEKYIRSQREMPLALFCTKETNVGGPVYGPVIRDVYLFECCTGGQGSVIINGKEFPFQEGDAYALLPGDAVSHTHKEGHLRSGYSCFACGLSLRHILSRAGITSSQPFVPKELFPVFLAQMEQMHAMREDDDPGAELRRTAYLYNMLGQLLKAGKERSRDSIIQKAVDIMETRYFEDLSVDELSREVGLERSYFSTFFKERTGFSPHQYLTRLRIQKACALMDQRDLSVFETAKSVGFDTQNFCRLFKKEMEITPLQYKKRMKNTDV